MTADQELLHRYATRGDEAAFRELTGRYAGLVFGTALRRLGDHASAEDAAQAVFTLLARKAGSLRGQVSLAGWLHRAVCHTAMHAQRSDTRRRRREQEAAALMPAGLAGEPASTAADRVPGVLDESLETLRDTDRTALLLRFGRGLSLREVGESLRLSEDGARMKISRALEKLRRVLARRGITSTSAALSASLAGAVAAVPPELIGRLSAAALSATENTLLSFTTTAAVMTTKAKLAFTGAGIALTLLAGAPFVITERNTLQERIAGLESKIALITASRNGAGLSEASGRPGDTRTASTATAAKGNGSRTDAGTGALADATGGTGAGKAKGGKSGGGAEEKTEEEIRAGDDAVKRMISSQTKGMIESMYGDLLDEWEMEGTERAKLVDVLNEPMAAAGTEALTLLKEGYTEEGAKKLEAISKKTAAERDTQLKEALAGTPGRYEQFKQYEDSVPERQVIRPFREALDKDGGANALTEAQEKQLMDLMHRERKTAGLGASAADVTHDDPSTVSTEGAAKHFEKAAEVDRRVTEAAAAFLNPAQMKLFTQQLTTQRAMEKSSMEMATSLFTKKKNGE